TPEPLDAMATEIAREVDRLRPGNQLFNPPAEMVQARKERIEFRLSNGPVGDLANGLQGPGSPVIGSIPIAKSMRVRLTADPDDFAIAALKDEIQVVPDNMVGEWAWDVTPLRGGERDLHLVVAAMLHVESATDSV